MEDFTKDFKEHGISGLEELVQADASDKESVEINILAGLAQGKPQIEIESVMEFARFNQGEIARFKCARGGKA